MSDEKNVVVEETKEETAQTPLWKDWKLHLAVFACSVVAQKIGIINIPLGPASLMLMPMIYAMVFALALFLIKPIKFIGLKQARESSPLLMFAVIFLVAKMGISMIPSIEIILSASAPLVIQNIGNLGTIFFALPVALLLGCKREAIGLSFALSREGGIAIITDKYGAKSAEFQGVMACYIVGTVFGPLFFGMIPGLFVDFGIFGPEATAMAVGCGSTSMMTAGLTVLIEKFPQMESELTGFAMISNIISGLLAFYLSIFLALPMTEKLYNVLTRNKSKKMKGAE